MTLVRKIDDVWQEWHGDAEVEVMASTFTAVYGDGRPPVEMACEPYPVTVLLNGGKVAQLHADGIWSDQEITSVGAATFIPFVPPSEMQVIGPPSYIEEDGVVRQIYEVEPIPAPAPEPSTEEKLGRMLSDYGLSRDDLKAVLAEGGQG